MKRPSLLVVHPWMGRGGSEATAMWSLQALQDDYEITFVTAAHLREEDWTTLNEIYGTSVDLTAIKLVKAPALPGVNGPRRIPYLQIRYFERFCLKLAPQYDLCLSTYNPIYFGRPAVQLIGDFSFDEEMRRRLHIYGQEPLRHRKTLLRQLYLYLGNWIEVKKPPLRAWEDRILANSGWVARQFQEYFGMQCPEVLFPPVPLPTAPSGVERDPWSFVCLGRIVPEKEIERMIAILEQVRTMGFPVTLTLIGDLNDSDYSREIGALVERHSYWIEAPGFLQLEKKQAALARHAFALHTCRIEAFGIVVAEMAAMGCIPFVPASGGAGEIIPFPELQFETEDEAVVKIVTLLRNETRIRELAEMMPKEAIRFSPMRFVERLREFMLDYHGSRLSRGHETTRKNL